MKKLLSLFLVMFLFATTHVFGQAVVTSEPSLIQESSQNVVITFHADRGNQGIKGVTSSTEVYAHIGVLTNKSTGSGDWKYVKADWGVNIPACKLTYVSANKWKLSLGNIRTYFGITDTNERIEKIAMVFRTADNSKEGKTASGGDIFLDVYPEGYQMLFNNDAASNIITDATKSISFNIETTANSKLELFLNSTSSTPLKSVASGTALSYTYTFSSRGNATFIARATNGSTVVEKSVTFCYPNNSVAATYPGGVPKMGAVENADGSVTFCIAAPGKKNAIIVPSWDDYQALDKNVMKYQDYNGNRYFWITVSGLDPDVEYPYYYAIDATIKVGDPYAKLILDPWSDKWISDDVYPNMIAYPTDKGVDGIMLAVYKGTRDKYNWKVKNFQAPEAKDLIIYEMLFRDFTGDEGKSNGNGTIRKAIEKFDYIKELGVNAVELMPIMEFNGNNSWGYNTNFYFAPDKAYGTPDEYREFIDLCHQNGIAVILDIVFNQSDGLHPWYQMYDIASNPFYNASAPHAYSVLNDWKQDNALVQQQWKDVLKYWLEAYKVDGFRFDLVKGLGDNNSYGGGTDGYNQSRVKRMKALHAAMKEVNPNAYFINENLAGAQEENEMAADGQINWANINNPACQFAMGYQQDSYCNRFYAPKDSRTWGSTVSYCESHDEERVAYKQKTYGRNEVKNSTEVQMLRLGSLAAQMILAPGPHMIWQFGEIGADQTTKNTDGGNNTDPKTVIWSYLDNEYRKGLYDCYKELIWIRTKNPELFNENATVTINCDYSNWASGRTLHIVNGDKELFMAVNPNYQGTQRSVGMSGLKNITSSNYQILSHSYGNEPTVTVGSGSGSIRLKTHCYAVIGTNNLAGIEDVIVDSDENKVNVYGGQGQIIIEGEYDYVAVYSISGQKYNTLNVPAGLYIVNVDGNATKVIVK